MSKTLIRLLKRFVREHFKTRTPDFTKSKYRKNLGAFIASVRGLTVELFQSHMTEIFSHGYRLTQLESFVGFFISPQKCE